jgi:ABC-type sulfate transport system permease subunit
MAFARAVGEYGSVIFIAGNVPMVSEITPLMIITKLEQYDYAGATAVASVMLVISFVLLLIINGLQGWMQNRYTAEEPEMSASIALQPGSLERQETRSTREPAWVKVVLISIALTFFAVFLLLPLGRFSPKVCARAGARISHALVNPTPGRRSS